MCWRLHSHHSHGWLKCNSANTCPWYLVGITTLVPLRRQPSSIVNSSCFVKKNRSSSGKVPSSGPPYNRKYTTQQEIHHARQKGSVCVAPLIIDTEIVARSSWTRFTSSNRCVIADALSRFPRKIVEESDVWKVFEKHKLWVVLLHHQIQYICTWDNTLPASWSRNALVMANSPKQLSRSQMISDSRRTSSKEYLGIANDSHDLPRSPYLEWTCDNSSLGREMTSNLLSFLELKLPEWLGLYAAKYGFLGDPPQMQNTSLKVARKHTSISSAGFPYSEDDSEFYRDFANVPRHSYP